MTRSELGAGSWELGNWEALNGRKIWDGWTIAGYVSPVGSQDVGWKLPRKCRIVAHPYAGALVQVASAPERLDTLSPALDPAFTPWGTCRWPAMPSRAFQSLHSILRGRSARASSLRASLCRRRTDSCNANGTSLVPVMETNEAGGAR